MQAAQRIHRSEPPRQYALGGRQLSGAEMAREKAAGIAVHVYRSDRRRRAIERLVRFTAHRCLPSSPASPFPPTSADNLYLRVHAALRRGTVARRRGAGFWDRKWELERAIATEVYRAHVAAMRAAWGA